MEMGPERKSETLIAQHCLPLSRCGSRFGRVEGELSKDCLYLPIGNLTEIAVEKPDCTKDQMIFQTYDFVGLSTQFR